MSQETPKNEGDDPNPSKEITQLLESDATRLGEVFRLDREGKLPFEIAEELGVETSGFVSNYKTTASAILTGQAPDSPTLSGQIASRVRKWLKTYSFTETTERHLGELLVELELRAENSSARTAEDTEALKQTELAEARKIPGVYVYALPHYIRHPIDPDTGRTYLKVGHSGRDVFGRAHAQGRITALPEDPIYCASTRPRPTSQPFLSEPSMNGLGRQITLAIEPCGVVASGS